MILLLSLNSDIKQEECKELQCENGFECRTNYINGRNIEFCSCDPKLFNKNCSRCKNFRMDLATNCTTCTEDYLDYSTNCRTCVAGKNLDIYQDCDKCVDLRFDRSTNCETCTQKHMTIQSNCTACD